MWKKYKIWLILDIVLLFVLYLGSFTDNFFHEQTSQIWTVSVIMDMAEDNAEKNFLSGLEKASKKHKMDMRYLNIRKYKSNPEKLIELTEKEIVGGCDALILGCNEKEAEKIVGMLPVGIPVILIDTPVEFSNVKAWFQQNEKDTAQKIIDLLVDKEKRKKEVLLVTYPESSDQVQRIHDILAWKLIRAGINSKKIEISSDEDWTIFAKEMDMDRDYVVVSADTLVLEMITTQCIKGDSRFPIYGVGWSGIIRRGLEDNVISAVIVPHTFETGYMAIYKIKRIMKDLSIKEEQAEIQTIVVTKDNLYGDKKTEAVLFPFL